jgi:hypothetical protein
MANTQELIDTFKGSCFAVNIERVLLLDGGYEEYRDSNGKLIGLFPADQLHLNVSEPFQQGDFSSRRYGLLTTYHRNGITELGHFRPTRTNIRSRIFTPFSEHEFSFYDLVSCSNGNCSIVGRIHVPFRQFCLLEYFEDSLGVPGISVKEEYTPVGTQLEFVR